MRFKAVVLKYSGGKLALLSEKSGRIDCYYYLKQSWGKLSSGTLVTYIPGKTKGERATLDDLTIEYVPLFCARKDIVFLHSFLEICTFYIPVGSGGSLFYSFLIYLYKDFVSFNTLYQQKIVLCKELAILGVCPEHKQFYSSMRKLLALPIDNLAQTDIQLIKEDILDQWLTWCIDSHPQGKWFKAMPFLLKSENQ